VLPLIQSWSIALPATQSKNRTTHSRPGLPRATVFGGNTLVAGARSPGVGTLRVDEFHSNLIQPAGNIAPDAAQDLSSHEQTEVPAWGG